MKTIMKHLYIPVYGFCISEEHVLGLECLPYYNPQGTFNYHTFYNWESPIPETWRRAFLKGSNYKGMLFSKVQVYK